MYLGLDVSKANIACIGKDKDGNELYRNKIPTSATGMDCLLEDVGNGNVFTVETSTHGVFVYDYLTSKGMDVKVANPAKIRLIYKSEKKTDWEDAGILADLLRTNMLPLCYFPNKQLREVRDLIRQRRSMVEMQTMVRNKIRSIVAREGITIPYKDVLGKKAVKTLGELEIENCVQKNAIDRLIGIGLMFDDEIQSYDDKIADKYATMEYTKLLDTIPGISTYSAVHIASAIGDIHRFPSDEELASYAGVVPKTRQSGETRIDMGLRHGDRQLKCILVQVANASIKRSSRLRRLYLKMKKKKGHQKAIIAVSRKIVYIIYCMLTRGEPYIENYGK